ncbi:MAG: ATP-binding protein, partial [Deltaproteobacteria bacterium]|nr:ATP-binding protein [Deltaproteobacteria bacterium]
DGSGKVVNYVGVLRDTTREHQLSEQLRQSQKMEAIGTLAGGVAHDFNNLLTVIEGYSDLLLSRLGEGNPLAAEVREIRKASDSASALTRQLLAFSRMQVFQPKVIDLNGLVTNVRKMLGRLIGENIDLVTVAGADLGRVKVDASQVEQVLMNLVVNARDAMPDGGRITIETSNVTLDESFAGKQVVFRPGPYVMLTVADTGTGMNQETMSRIFEPFFTTKETGKGTGLGLATVYGIVKQSGGYIWVYSEPGHGTTFKIHLPRVDEQPEEEAPRPQVPARSSGSETVLVVEDTDMVKNLVREILVNSGYTVLEASDGNEALALCERRKEPIHLLVTDMMMPGMSGTELAKAVSSIRPGTKVLYMSGYTEYGSADNPGLPGGSFFIQKPFSVAGLARKVREVLES